MSDAESIQELVVLFDAAATAVQRELTMVEFERLRDGLDRLEARAGESVRAAYVTVEPGLRVGGFVCFLLPVERSGQVSGSFNVPIRYLAEFAGVRQDLGIGPVRVASRAQCPVPWMALNLWEPDSREAGTAQLIQRAVLLNRIGLKSDPVGLLTAAGQQGAAIAARTAEVGQALRVAKARLPVDTAGLPGMNTGPGLGAGRTAAPSVSAPATPVTPAAPASGESRDALAAMDPGYPELVRRLRVEIQGLKVALRHEKERNRRLQGLLRGEF